MYAMIITMQIDWNHVRRVLLNELVQRKPSKSVFKRVGHLLPDANIFGFSWYVQGNCYALLVESKIFPANPYGVVLDIPITSLSNYHAPLQLVSG